MREYQFEHAVKECPTLVLRARAEEHIASCSWYVSLHIPEHGWSSSEATWRITMRPRGMFPRDLDLERQEEICRLLGVTRSKLLVDAKTKEQAWQHYWSWANTQQESFHALGALGTRLRNVGGIMRGSHRGIVYPSDQLAADKMSCGLPDGWPQALGQVLIEASQLLPTEV